MKKRSNITKYLYFGAITLLVMAFGILVLEKSQLTNFYNKPLTSEESESVRQINDIQYTPADPTDNNDINSQKENGTIGQSENSSNGSTENINVVLTAAGQDVKGGPVVVKVLLNNVSTGTCDVVLSKNDLVKNYTASVVNTGTYYSCDGFEIPIDELESGEWNIKVIVSDSDKSGQAEKTIRIEN